VADRERQLEALAQRGVEVRPREQARNRLATEEQARLGPAGAKEIARLGAAGEEQSEEEQRASHYSASHTWRLTAGPPPAGAPAARSRTACGRAGRRCRPGRGARGACPPRAARPCASRRSGRHARSW